MSLHFQGKVVLVTGAARGIGAGIVRRIVAEGGKAALVGLEPEAMQQIADELGPEKAAVWTADARDGVAVRAAVDAAAEHFGRIDYVVANAGIASYGTVRQISEDAFVRVVDINVNGVFRTLHAAIPHLEKTRGYALVISSLAAFTPLAGLAAYNASKAGAESLALAANQEVAHLGITIGTCHPSWIDTDIVRGAEADLPTFREIRKKLPFPANTTTTLEDCVEMIVHGMRARKRRIYVPRKVGFANWLKAFVASPAAWPVLRSQTAKHVPAMEAEVEALGGRFHHAHVPVTEEVPPSDG